MSSPSKPSSEQENGKSLERLYKSQSTSRVLNLLRVHRQYGKALGSHGGFRPIFHAPMLNKGFIVKHKLRPSEADMFVEPRQLATKIIVPFDAEDLSMGGQSFFVGEQHFGPILTQVCGGTGGDPHDLNLLLSLDQIPSFDPFILREWTQRRGFSIAAEYFELDPAVAFRMEGLVVAEVKRLVNRSFQGAAAEEAARKLVAKLLSGGDEGDVAAFRSLLSLNRDEFQEAMFSWRGFLYYKWTAIQIEADIERVVGELRSVQIRDAGPDTKNYISQARGRICLSLVDCYNEMVSSIENYDQAYRRFVEAGEPGPFRNFLANARTRFYRLGELIAQINHVVQFWSFRSKGGRELIYDGDELAALLRDFEIGLGTDLINTQKAAVKPPPPPKPPQKTRLNVS